MKAAPTNIEGLADLEHVATSGDLRRIVANSLLALVRKEISATDVEALAKGLDAISNSLNTEIKIARTAAELRATGGDIGKTPHLGQMMIGNASRAES